MDKIKPFPRNYARAIDILPVLSLQDNFDHDRKYSLCTGIVSHGNHNRRPDKELVVSGVKGILERVKSTTMNYKLKVGKGGFSDTFDLGEVRESLADAGVEANPEEDQARIDAVIHERMIIEKSPKHLPPLLESLQTANELAVHQTNFGYNPHNFRWKTRIPFWKIKQNLLKPQLTTAGKWERSIVKRLRGIMATNFIMLDDGSGWDKISTPTISRVLQQQITDNEGWYRDTATPLELPLSSTPTEVSIYRLSKYTDHQRTTPSGSTPKAWICLGTIY